MHKLKPGSLTEYLAINNITSLKDIDANEICNTFNVSRKTLSNRVGELKKNKLGEPHRKSNSIKDELSIPSTPNVIKKTAIKNNNLNDEISKSKSSNGNIGLVSNSATIQTEEELIAHARIDLTTHRIIYSKINTWNALSKNLDGTTSVVSMWQVKVNLAPINSKTVKLNEDYIIDTILKQRPAFKQPKLKSEPKSGYNFVLSIPDLHLGKYGVANETNNEVNTKKSRDKYWEAFRQLIQKCTKYNTKLDQLTLIIGNDFFNYDGHSRSTTKGTPQDTDVRWTDMYDIGFNLLSECIEYAKGIASHVHVISIPGNHDLQTMFYLGYTLEKAYARDERVTVESKLLPRKYFKWGVTLFGLTHGDEEKPATLPLLMANEAKENWAETKYREWLIGHFHKSAQHSYRASDEFDGVQVITMPSLSGADYWHFTKGYVSNTPRAVGRLYHYDTGLEAVFNWNCNI